MIAAELLPVNRVDAKGEGWGLGTVFLLPREAARLAYAAGFSDAIDLFTIVAIGGAESQWGVKAFSDNRTVLSKCNVGQKVRNPELYQLYVVIDPAKGTLRLEDGSIETHPPESEVVTSRDVGWLEINIPAAQIGTAAELSLYDPVVNVQRAFSLYSSPWGEDIRGFQPWAAYNSGVYLHDHYAGTAALGVLNFGVERFNAAGATLPLPLFTTAELRAKLLASK